MALYILLLLLPVAFCQQAALSGFNPSQLLSLLGGGNLQQFQQLAAGGGSLGQQAPDFSRISSPNFGTGSNQQIPQIFPSSSNVGGFGQLFGSLTNQPQPQPNFPFTTQPSAPQGDVFFPSQPQQPPFGQPQGQGFSAFGSNTFTSNPGSNIGSPFAQGSNFQPPNSGNIIFPGSGGFSGQPQPQPFGQPQGQGIQPFGNNGIIGSSFAQGSNFQPPNSGNILIPSNGPNSGNILFPNNGPNSGNILFPSNGVFSGQPQQPPFGQPQGQAISQGSNFQPPNSGNILFPGNGVFSGQPQQPPFGQPQGQGIQQTFGRNAISSNIGSSFGQGSNFQPPNSGNILFPGNGDFSGQPQQPPFGQQQGLGNPLSAILTSPGISNLGFGSGLGSQPNQQQIFDPSSLSGLLNPGQAQPSAPTIDLSSLLGGAQQPFSPFQPQPQQFGSRPGADLSNLLAKILSPQGQAPNFGGQGQIGGISSLGFQQPRQSALTTSLGFPGSSQGQTTIDPFGVASLGANLPSLFRRRRTAF